LLKNPKISKELKNKVILITGGAGSIGSELTKRILEYPVKSVRVLDINEHALFKLNKSLDNPKLRILLGSIIDKDRLEMAGRNVDIVIHLAALKNLEITETNPIETIDVNINGTTNIIKMGILNNISKILNVSTDKAAEPSNLYGTTKQVSERLVSWAGNRNNTSKFGTVRFGNVMETRGNVFEIWKEQVENKIPISITDPTMKRFYFHVHEAVDFILECLPLINNGEIFVPKMKSFKIKELADKISKKQKIIGARTGEKIEEILITKIEQNLATEKNNMWIIPPTL
jgi:UDP-N-acetylglucosamine 4,6-dehydratase